MGKFSLFSLKEDKFEIRKNNYPVSGQTRKSTIRLPNIRPNPIYYGCTLFLCKEEKSFF